MIRLIKEKIIGWLKTIFKGDNMSFEFPTFKVAEIEASINLKDQATTDGKNNLPRTNARTFSNCENEAITKTDELRNKEVKKAAEYLKPKKKTIADTQSELDKKPYYIEQFENIIQKTLNDAVGKLSNLKNAFSTEDNQVRTFKLENRLSREPRPLTTIGIIIGLIVVAVLFYVELEVNSNLLAPAMTSGKAEGLAIAGAVAGFNVLVSFFIGIMALFCLVTSFRAWQKTSVRLRAQARAGVSEVSLPSAVRAVSTICGALRPAASYMSSGLA